MHVTRSWRLTESIPWRHGAVQVSTGKVDADELEDVVARCGARGSVEQVSSRWLPGVFHVRRTVGLRAVAV